jgi:signal transduction histidine kinase
VPQQVLSFAVAAVFVLLGILTFADWLRYRDRAHGYLALAIGSLGFVAVLGRLEVLDPDARPFLTSAAVLVFLASAYTLLLLRSEFIPLSARAHLAVLALLAVVAAFFISTSVVPSTSPPRPLFLAAAAALGFAWSACVCEPVVRFWIASSGRPAVQTMRMRSLSLAYGGLIAIVVLALLIDPLSRSPVIRDGSQVVALLLAPVLYASFSPPNWVRFIWRSTEEEALRQGYRELLLFSPNRKALAEKALEWACRLVGGEAGFIADGNGHLLASRGLRKGAAEQFLARIESGERPLLLPVEDRTRHSAVAVSLPLEEGRGALVVLAGPFTPLFGSDEITRLGLWATAITAGLDRVLLTERISALEQSKSQFLNLASHELRGPITVLRGYLSMAATGALGKLSPELRKVMPLLIGRADEMNGLVEQMIEAARLEEGRLELKPEQADLREIAARALELVRPLADETHPLVIEVPPDEVPVVVDADRIAIIVSNLITNAIKYSPEGGEVRCCIVRDKRLAKVRVSDAGVGIAPKDLPRLFTRFGRISNHATNHVPGTGLGLYLSRELARMHGGDLTVESTPGKGSTFTLAVPMRAAPN